MHIGKRRLIAFRASTERVWRRRSGWSNFGFLEAGIDIYVEPTEFDSIGVDTEEDRAAVEKILLRRLSAPK